MKKIIIASMFALGLAACGGAGGGAKATIAQACLDEDGTDEKTCNCLADKAVNELDPKLVNILVESTKAEDDDAYMMSKMAELSPEEMTSLMSVMMSAATECGLEI